MFGGVSTCGVPPKAVTLVPAQKGHQLNVMLSLLPGNSQNIFYLEFIFISICWHPKVFTVVFNKGPTLAFCSVQVVPDTVLIVTLM